MHALYSVLSRFSERETVAIRIGLAPRARDWGHAGLVLPRLWLGTPEGKAALNMPAGYASGRANHRWTSESRRPFSHAPTRVIESVRQALVRSSRWKGVASARRHVRSRWKLTCGHPFSQLTHYEKVMLVYQLCTNFLDI